MDTLTIEWIDPRGKVWNLTTGDEGVLLDVGQSDLTLSPIEHTYLRGGTQWAGSRVKQAEPSLKVLIGETGGDPLTGTPYYTLADEWWTKANSPVDEGTLRITRPDGEVRELRCRLRDTPGTKYDYDPGSGIAEVPGEAWLLTSPAGYYSGPEQSVMFGGDAIDNGMRFYGPNGYGWPLYIAPANSASNVFVANRGQGPVWLTWTLVGPMVNPRFGTSGGVLSYEGTIPAGEVVVVSTEPGYRYAIEAGSGDNRYGKVSGVYAPLPVGDRVPLTIVAEGMSTASSFTVTTRELFARPF